MASPRSERRLAAILAADVAGYSRMVAEDESAALQRFRAHLDELIEPSVSVRGGRIIKTMGDGLLVQFASAVEALQCAIDIQRGLSARNAAAPESARMEFRMGLHAGDVVVEDGDVFGADVTVACRLQELSPPGGIWISARVREDAQGRVSAAFEDAGERRLKNIDRPVRVFSVRRDWPQAPAPPQQPERASIAVLPFQNMSGDPDQDYFADGVSEDIITALSRWKWFFVIARNSSFIYRGRAVDVKQVGRELGVRYVLEGSVRKAGARVRIVAQLIDAATAAHVWSDSFDRDVSDMFALQDEITEHVVTAIEPAMLHQESSRVARKSAADLTAFDCFQRGMWRLNKLTRADFDEAKALFEEAIARDPESPLGHTGLSRILYGMVMQGWSSAPYRDLIDAKNAALTAISLDPRDAHAHFALSGALLHLGRQSEALEEAVRTVSLNPNLAFAHFRRGQVLLCLGRAEEAIPHIERSIRHNPYDPQNGAMQTALALALFHAGRFEEAASRALEAQSLNYPRGALIRAASLARLGRIEDARAAFSEDVQRAALAARFHMPYAHDMDLLYLLDALRLAGLAPDLAPLVTARLEDAPAPA
ncbi:MAG: adenylate/guanylate cyclase domain-containing protein [Hyphomonadaceae bacterium]